MSKMRDSPPDADLRGPSQSLASRISSTDCSRAARVSEVEVDMVQ